jgi:DNA-directed RNA polymerase subunit L
MSKVYDIKYNTVGFNKSVPNIIKKYGLTLSKTTEKYLVGLTPPETHSVRYKVKNTNTSICNGFRRIALNELPWVRLTSMPDTIECQDPYCSMTKDYFINRLNLVPVQFLDDADLTEYSFTISVKNLEDNGILIITSNDIKPMNKKSEKVEFTKNIRLTEIRGGFNFDCKITICRGENRQSVGYSSLFSLYYDAIDYDTNSPKLPPSYSVTPEHYELGFSCEKFIDPKKTLKYIWTCFKDRMVQIKNTMDTFTKNNDIPYTSDLLQVSTIKNDYVQYKFIGETYTTIYPMAWYIYLAKPKIDFVSSTNNHPHDLFQLLIINDANHTKLINNAIKDIIKELDDIIKQCK